MNHFIALNRDRVLERNEKVSAGTELCKDPFKLVKTHSSLGRTVVDRVTKLDSISVDEFRGLGKPMKV